jgi:uncharacterized delta-60 repeat protein
MARGLRRERAALCTLTAAFALTACNALLGIDDASVDPAGSPGGAGGRANDGGQAGGAPAGGPGVNGAGGDGNAGGSAGNAPTSGIDRSFGDAGLATLRPAKLYPDGYRLASLHLQPTGKVVVGGTALFDQQDPTNTDRPAIFAARFGENGALDATFGEQGLAALAPQASYGITGDFVRAAAVEPEGGLLMSFRYSSKDSYYPDQAAGFGVVRLGRDGQKLSEWRHDGAATDPPPLRLFGYGLFAPPGACYVFNNAYYVSDATGNDSIDVAPCDGGFDQLAYLSLPLPAGVGPTSGFDGDLLSADPAPPFVAPNASLFVPLGDDQGNVGVAKIVRVQGAPALDVTFGGGTGYVLGAPDALASPIRVTRAAVADPTGAVYLGGQSRPADVDATQPPTPFLVKFRADGAGLDATFGNNGVAPWLDGGTVSCILVDDQARLLVAGSRVSASASDPLLARVTPAGTLDPTFGNGGVVALPFEPHRCAFDAAGRVVLAGALNDALGVPTVALARVFNADGPAGAGVARPRPSCEALDETEPNDDRALATPLVGPRGSSEVRPPDQTVAWKGLLKDGQDIDWYRYSVREGNQLSPGASLRANVIADASAYLCLYFKALNAEISTADRFDCADGSIPDDATVPGYVGCCNVASVSTTYQDATPPIGDIDVFLRVTRTTPEASDRCDLYRISSIP